MMTAIIVNEMIIVVISLFNEDYVLNIEKRKMNLVMKIGCFYLVNISLQINRDPHGMLMNSFFTFELVEQE